MGIVMAEPSLSNQRKGVVERNGEAQRHSLDWQGKGEAEHRSALQRLSMEKQGNGIVLRSMAKALMGESQ